VGVGGRAGVLVLITDKPLDTVTRGMASLTNLGQRSIANGLVGNALSDVVALLVGVAVLIDLADSGRLGLGGRGQSKAGKHGGNNESGLHIEVDGRNARKGIMIDDVLVGKECWFDCR
jgi:lipid-binding SYLF domain-containing protein